MSVCKFCTGTGVQPPPPTEATDDVNRCEYVGHLGTRCLLTPHGPTFGHSTGRGPLVFVDDDESVSPKRPPRTERE